MNLRMASMFVAFGVVAIAFSFAPIQYVVLAIGGQRHPAELVALSLP